MFLFYKIQINFPSNKIIKLIMLKNLIFNKINIMSKGNSNIKRIDSN